MQLGPVKFEFNGPGPIGVFYRSANGVEQNVTIPAIAIAVVLLLCCCGGVIF